MRVVVDTNCLIASIPSKSEDFWLYLAFIKKDFIWVVSTDILNEYHEKLSEFYNSKTADIVLEVLLTAPNVEFAEPFFKWGLIIDDPDDNKFADLAISNNAQYLVSNDKHFNIFKKIDFPPLKVVKLKQFKKILGL
ncbi:MAG: putative toxin-antitoxin system toxin component, PIN family [Spirosomataceae bacterium]